MQSRSQKSLPPATSDHVVPSVICYELSSYHHPLLLPCQILASYCSYNTLGTSSPRTLLQLVPSAWKPLPPDRFRVCSHLAPIVAHRSPAQWELPCSPSPWPPLGTFITSPGQVGPWPLISLSPSSSCSSSRSTQSPACPWEEVPPQVSGSVPPSAGPSHAVGTLQAAQAKGQLQKTCACSQLKWLCPPFSCLQNVSHTDLMTMLPWSRFIYDSRSPVG